MPPLGAWTNSQSAVKRKESIDQVYAKNSKVKINRQESDDLQIINADPWSFDDPEDVLNKTVEEPHTAHSFKRINSGLRYNSGMLDGYPSVM